MRARFHDLGRSGSSRRLRLELEPAPEDPVETPEASLARNRATFTLPAEFALERVHPDVLALAALLTCQPWIGSRLLVERPVSAAFATVVEHELGIAIEPVDPVLPARERPAGPRPGLAYSGGVDSVAAAGLLPGEPVLYFLDRAVPMSGRDAIDKEAARVSCADMRAKGFQVREIATDLEYLRRPTGVPVTMPTDLSFALPAVLCADLDGLDALTTGILAETGRFRKTPPEHPLRQWQAVTAAVGLGMQPVLSGFTEVATSLLATAFWGDEVLAQSCVVGRPGEPCGACRNCYRKSLIVMAHSGEWLENGDVRRLICNFQALGDIATVPAPLESSMAFTLGRYDGDDPRLLALRDLYCEPGEDLEWTTLHYGPALDLLDDRYREPVRLRIAEHFDSLDDARIEACKTWDRRPRAVHRDRWRASQRVQYELTDSGTPVPSRRGVRAETRSYLPRGVGDRRPALTESLTPPQEAYAPEIRLSVLVPRDAKTAWEKLLDTRPVEVLDVEPGAAGLAEGLARATGDVLMWTASGFEPSEASLESHLRRHRIGENVMVADRPTGTVSLHRKLLVASCGYDESMGADADAELAYRAALAGAVVIDAEGDRVSPWRDAPAGDDIAFAQAVPESSARDGGRWRSWTVPSVDVFMDVDLHDYEAVMACAVPLLSGECRDVRLTLVGPWPAPRERGRNPVSESDMVRESLGADSRVRFCTWDGLRADPSVPWRMQVSPDLGPEAADLAKLLAEAEHSGAPLTVVEREGRRLARLERRAAFARAVWSGATPADLDEHVANLAAESAPQHV